MIYTAEQALEFIHQRYKDKKTNKPFIVAVDGRCASGKTTFAKMLCAVIIHTDDFYKPKNEKGMLEISLYSGNFDLNRFKSEIVAPLLKGEPFEYGIFDCGMQKITKTVKVSDLDFIVVEGSYSQHEDLGEYADIKLFFDISNEEQQKRILARNGINAKQGFDNIWIPAEERYFERYSIKEKANIIVTTEV